MFERSTILPGSPKHYCNIDSLTAVLKDERQRTFRRLRWPAAVSIHKCRIKSVPSAQVLRNSLSGHRCRPATRHYRKRISLRKRPGSGIAHPCQENNLHQRRNARSDNFHVVWRPGGGTQAANCAAPERTSPTSQRIHVTVCDDFPTTDYSESSKDPICLLAGNRRQDDL